MPTSILIWKMWPRIKPFRFNVFFCNYEMYSNKTQENIMQQFIRIMHLKNKLPRWKLTRYIYERFSSFIKFKTWYLLYNSSSKWIKNRYFTQFDYPYAYKKYIELGWYCIKQNLSDSKIDLPLVNTQTCN